jgi:hypothetical protein
MEVREYWWGVERLEVRTWPDGLMDIWHASGEGISTAGNTKEIALAHWRDLYTKTRQLYEAGKSMYKSDWIPLAPYPPEKAVWKVRKLNRYTGPLTREEYRALESVPGVAWE